LIKQLLPILILSGIFSIYGLVQLARYCFWETLDERVLDDLITNITPVETPFSRMIAGTQASDPSYKGNDLNNV
jgi:hypothetical protein